MIRTSGRVVFQAASQGVVPVLRRQISQHLGGIDEQGAVPCSTAWWAMFWAIIDLPTPLGPTRMRLAASRIKPRVMSSATTAWSHCAGQPQSKSANGFEATEVGGPRRRSSPRRFRSTSSQATSCCTQTKSGRCQGVPVSQQAIELERGHPVFEFIARDRCGVGMCHGSWFSVSSSKS